jgi:hypothetical protein
MRNMVRSCMVTLIGAGVVYAQTPSPTMEDVTPATPQELARLEGAVLFRLEACKNEYSATQTLHAKHLSGRAERVLTLVYGLTPEIIQSEFSVGAMRSSEHLKANPNSGWCDEQKRQCFLLDLSERDTLRQAVLGPAGAEPTDWPKKEDGAECGTETTATTLGPSLFKRP